VDAYLQIQADDSDTFVDLFRKHQPDVLSYVCRLSRGNIVLAEDITQQVFLSFWTHRNNYDLSKPFMPLLLTMAHNAWLNALKREDYRKVSPLHEEGAVHIDREMDERDLEKALEKALSDLDGPVREVFILSRYHGLKYEQISKRMGVSVKTVEARLSRALQELQNLLKDYL
jgi:RNA polymerase sigma-70 factor (ECF subfamily)